MFDPLTLAIAGTIISGIGSGIGGVRQANANALAQAEQRQRQRQIDNLAAGHQSRGPNGNFMPDNTPWGNALTSQYNQVRQTPNETFAFDPLVANNLTADNVDTTMFNPNMGGGTALPSWVQGFTNNDIGLSNSFLDFNRLINPNAMGTGANSSQDALMQLIRGGAGTQAMAGSAGISGFNANARVDPITGQVSDTARSNLEQLTENGGRFDLDSMFAALNAVEQRQQGEQIANLQGSAGSIGQRFGSVLNSQEGRLRESMQEQANLRRQELARQSFETAQGRRLQGAAGLTAQDQIINQIMGINQGNQTQVALGNLNAGVTARGQDANVAISNADNATRASVSNAGNQTAAAQALATLQASLYSTQMNGNTAFNNATTSLMNTGADSATRLALGNQDSGVRTNLAENSFNLANSTTRQGDLALLQQLLSGNAAANNNMAQFNEGNRLGAGEFNISTAQSAFNTNQQQQQWQQSILSQLLGMGIGNENARDNRGIQALGIQAGVSTPGANPNAGAGANAFGDAGNLLAMIGLLNRRGGTGGSA